MQQSEVQRFSRQQERDGGQAEPPGGLSQEEGVLAREDEEAASRSEEGGGEGYGTGKRVPWDQDDVNQAPFSVVVVEDPELVQTSSAIALLQQQVGLVRLARGLVKEIGLLEAPI